MGIPSYFSYIVKNHIAIIQKLTKNKINIHNFYLDCNSIVYDCVHNLQIDKTNADNLYNVYTDTIIHNVCVKIEEYINTIQPTHNIFIAFDGVAPVAKLEQQRSRRYKSTYQQNISKAIFKDKQEDPWNTTAITPGTVFMSKLNSKIKEKFHKMEKKYKVSKIILSTSDEHGEGEHKLFKYIRDYPDEHTSKNTIVYGLDADLIMLAINHLPISNIYLFRETPSFIKSIHVDLEPNETYLLDIPELAKTIIREMNNDNDEMTTKEQHNRIYDYIFMCFFLGNDFMPHFPSINIRTGGVNKMMNAYKATIGNTKENLTDGTIIYWKNVKKLVTFLANMEEEYLKTESKQRNKMENNKLANNTPEEKWRYFDSIPVYERSIEKYINVTKSGWQNRYYKSLFEIEIDDSRKKQICVNYLEGLEWTMKYYTAGCPDWRWCYNYSYPPLLSDLLHYIPYFETTFITTKPEDPVNPLVQLCYVLPKQHLSLLPEKLYMELINKHSNWYKNDCQFIWAYCRYFWEAHVVLPHIELDELIKFVKTFK